MAAVPHPQGPGHLPVPGGGGAAGDIPVERRGPGMPGQAGPHPGGAGGCAELLRPDGRCVRPGSG